MIFDLTRARFVQPSLLLLLLLLTGCLPSSCNKTESRAISSADSLSRAFAIAIGEDTLTVFREPSRNDGLAYPRTILFDAGGFLYASDGENGGIWRTEARAASPTNARKNEVGSPGDEDIESVNTQLAEYADSTGLSAPYLAGFVGDSLVVFNAGSNDVAIVYDALVVSHFPLSELDASATLRYAGVNRNRVVVKALDEESGSRLAWYDLSGDRQEERRLKGPYWRHSGLMKSDGDSLLSLRGYLPSIDVYFESALIDSVGLYGFDSPMLARTRSFEYSSVKAPPLLSSSTAACGNRWYLLNVRPGWIRIDEYDRQGKLMQAYTQPNPTFDSALLTTDLAVWCSGDDPTIVAVSVVSPIPEIRWYLIPASGN